MTPISGGHLQTRLNSTRGCPRGVMVKAMDYEIVVREFVPQSRYYVHFRANTLGKGMNPHPYPPSYGLNSIYICMCISIMYMYVAIQHTFTHFRFTLCYWPELRREYPRGVMVKALDCGIVVSEFELQFHYYLDFHMNTLGKGMNPHPYPPSYGLKSTTTVLLEEWIWHKINQENWYAIKQQNKGTKEHVFIYKMKKMFSEDFKTHTQTLTHIYIYIYIYIHTWCIQ